MSPNVHNITFQEAITIETLKRYSKNKVDTSGGARVAAAADTGRFHCQYSGGQHIGVGARWPSAGAIQDTSDKETTSDCVRMVIALWTVLPRRGELNDAC